MYGIWLKPNNEVYVKYVRSAFLNFNYVVGYVNQYDHKLIALIAIYNKEVIKCDSFSEYVGFIRKKKKSSIITRILMYINKKLSNYLERSVKNGR